jgi:hypothetical protein
MPTRRRADTTPDLFASLPARADAPEQPTELGDHAARPKHLLPKDLAGALTRLADAEFDALLAAVTAEAKRRGRPGPTSREGGPTTAGSRSGRAPDVGPSSLTTGKLNAVRAAFRAGVKPAAIARQFGISQADVKNALAGYGHKSGR